MLVCRINQAGAHNQKADSYLLTDNQPVWADQLTPGLLLKKTIFKMAAIIICDLPACLHGKPGQQTAQVTGAGQRICQCLFNIAHRRLAGRLISRVQLAGLGLHLAKGGQRMVFVSPKIVS